MEEAKRFSEFLSLARALKTAYTGYFRRLVYRVRPDMDPNKEAAKDLVAAVQLASVAYTVLERYEFEDRDFSEAKTRIVLLLRESNDILVEVASETARRMGLPVVSEVPVASKELVLGQAKRNFGL